MPVPHCALFVAVGALGVGLIVIAEVVAVLVHPVDALVAVTV